MQRCEEKLDVLRFDVKFNKMWHSILLQPSHLRRCLLLRGKIANFLTHTLCDSRVWTSKLVCFCGSSQIFRFTKHPLRFHYTRSGSSPPCMQKPYTHHPDLLPRKNGFWRYIPFDFTPQPYKREILHTRLECAREVWVQAACGMRRHTSQHVFSYAWVWLLMQKKVCQRKLVSQKKYIRSLNSARVTRARVLSLSRKLRRLFLFLSLRGHIKWFLQNKSREKQPKSNTKLNCLRIAPTPV